MFETDKIDEHLDALIELIQAASDDFDAFVYGDSALARQVTQMALESGVGEFAPPHCLLLVDGGTPTGMFAALPASELADARLQMAITLVRKGLLDRTSPARRRSALANQTLIHPDEGDYYISKLAVSENCRGKRLGLRLMELAEKKACDLGLQRLVLDVAPAHERAIGFYDRYGFQVIDRKSIKDDETGDVIEHIHMAKNLD